MLKYKLSFKSFLQDIDSNKFLGLWRSINLGLNIRCKSKSSLHIFYSFNDTFDKNLSSYLKSNHLNTKKPMCIDFCQSKNNHFCIWYSSLKLYTQNNFKDMIDKSWFRCHFYRIQPGIWPHSWYDLLNYFEWLGRIDSIHRDKSDNSLQNNLFSTYHKEFCIFNTYLFDCSCKR